MGKKHLSSVDAEEIVKAVKAVVVIAQLVITNNRDPETFCNILPCLIFIRARITSKYISHLFYYLQI